MNEEIEVHDAEVIDPPPPDAGRGAAGKFLPGQQVVHRPKGSRGKVSHFLLESFSAYITERPDENPVRTLLDLANGRAFDKDGKAIEVPVSVRTTAASRLLATFVPPTSTARFGDVVRIDARGVEALTVLAKSPAYRAMAEKIIHLQAKARLVGSYSDSHIIEPGSQAALEAGPEVKE